MKTVLVSIGLSVLLYGTAMAQSRTEKSIPETNKKFEVSFSHSTVSTDNEALFKTYQSVAQKSAKESRQAKIQQPSEAQIVELQLVSILPSPKADVATVILGAYDQNRGFQMLLDADSNTYASIIPTSGPLYIGGDVPDSIYEKFEYKIPANADGKLSTENILINSEGSVDIPGGVYDFCITNPRPTAFTPNMMIAGGEYGRTDNFTFKAGRVYYFTVVRNPLTDVNTVSLKPGYDINVYSFRSPFYSSPDFTDSETVEFYMVNQGSMAIPSFDVAYSINEGEPVVETVTTTFEPATDYTHTFATKADLSNPGAYTIRSWVSFDGDENLSNDTIVKTVYNTNWPPVELPFTENFEKGSEYIEAFWTGASWYISQGEDATGNQDGTFMTLGDWGYEESEDYLMTTVPFIFEAGPAHAAFYYYPRSASNQKILEVYYGKSKDPAEMTLLKTINATQPKWLFTPVDFEIPEAGEYYIAFRGFLDDYYGLYIDEISVDKGYFSGTPDLAIQSVILPMSSCALTDSEKIGVAVSNEGLEPIHKFTLKYSVNGGEYVSQDFTDTLGIFESKIVYFTQTADFSTIGTTFEVKVIGSCERQEVFENDTAKSMTVNFAPKEAPMSSDFSQIEQASDWVLSVPGSWEYTETGTYAALDTNELISRCLSLQTGEYWLRYNYRAGTCPWYFPETDDFDVIYGKADTPISTWNTLKSHEQVYTDELFTENEIRFAIKEAGNYSFGFRPRTVTALEIASVEIVMAQEHDIRINNLTSSLSLLSNYIPKKHIANPEFSPEFSVEIENRGQYAEAGVKATVKHGSVLVGTSETVNLDVYTTQKLNFSGNLTDVTVGEKITLSAEVSMTNPDGLPEDNHAEYSFITVTDSVFAKENISNFEAAALGSNDGSVALGNVFTLTVPDTLTSISVAWNKADDGKTSATDPIGLAVYAVNEDSSLGVCYYSQEVVRGVGGEFTVYNVPGRLLPAGNYYFEVKQLESSSMNICIDTTKNGFFYMLMNERIITYWGLGNVGIRANFGRNNNKLIQYDAAVVSIDKPNDRGIFSTNEPIVATIRNNGPQDLSNIPVYCSAGNTQLSKTIESLASYHSATVTFEADMSHPATYTISVYTALSNDEDRSNDTVKREVISVEPANPYIMDFEECEDFAIDGFNPVWTTVDEDQAPTCGISNIAFPNAGENFAFIAFNPSATKPALSTNLMQAQNGERLGACFSSLTAPNNDWLISPKLQLGSNSHVDFYVKAFLGKDADGTIYTERYNVLVSTTDNQISSFTEVTPTAEAPDSEWTKVSVDLSKYDGKNIHLAFQCISDDAYIFMIDNIQVITNLSNASVAQDSRLTLYPNPTRESITIQGAAMNRIAVYNLWGAKVFESANGLHTDSYRINVSKFNSGVYFARVSTASGIQVLKFIVQ